MFKYKWFRIMFSIISIFVLLGIFLGCYLYIEYQSFVPFLGDSDNMSSQEYEEFRVNYIKEKEEERAQILKERENNPLDDSKYFNKELYDEVFGSDNILKIPLIQSDKKSIMTVFSSTHNPDDPENRIEKQVRVEMCDFDLAMQNLDKYSYNNEHYIENNILYVVENQEKYPLIYFTPNSFYLNLTVSNSLSPETAGNVLLDMYYLSFLGLATSEPVDESGHEDFYINSNAVTEIFYYISLYDDTLSEQLELIYKILAPLPVGYD